MNIYIYCRTSTTQQTDGLDTQESICRSFLGNLLAQEQWQRRFRPCITDTGRLSVQVKREHVSGSVPFLKRDVGGELLRQLQRGDHLCIAKLDRAFRSARDCHNTLAELKERGVSTSVCDLPDGADVTSNGIAALLIGIMSSVAEWERERIGERTKENKREAQRQGRFLGGHTPWEKKLVRGKLVDDPAKTQVVAVMRQLRGDGAGLRTIAQRVKAEGFSISTDAVQRLTKSVPGAIHKPGRRTESS